MADDKTKQKKNPKSGDDTTDSAGKKTSPQVDDAEEAAKGSDTQADSEEAEENDPTQPEVDDDDLAEDDDDGEEDDDGEDEDNESDRRPKRFTQEELNNFLKNKTAKLRRKFTREIESERGKNASLKAELDNYRSVEVTRAEEAFNALPESVREMAPVAIARVKKDSKAFKTFNDWLPKAKKLAEQIAAGNSEKKPAAAKPAGNLPDPAPAGVKGAEQKVTIPSTWKW